MWRGAVGVVANWSRGAWDAAAWWRVAALLRWAPCVREPVVKMTVNTAVFLFGQLMYEHVVVPVVAWIIGDRGIIFDWMFCLLWTCPVLLLCTMFNIWWFQDLMVALRRLVPERRRSSVASTDDVWVTQALDGYHRMLRGVAEEVFRLILLLLANAMAQLLYFRIDALFLPCDHIACCVALGLVRAVCFAYIAWAQALQVWDHVWVMSDRTLDFKLAQIECHPAYFGGFGAWMAAVLLLAPPHVGSGIYYAMMPFSVLAAMHARHLPQSTQFSPRIPFMRVLLPPIALGVLICAAVAGCLSDRPWQRCCRRDCPTAVHASPRSPRRKDDRGAS